MYYITEDYYETFPWIDLVTLPFMFDLLMIGFPSSDATETSCSLCSDTLKDVTEGKLLRKVSKAWWML